MVLPQLGGRVHVALDKTNGYDFIYRQDVIKPALVGLAGPWVSGGIEFNWPQHHRPATYMPADSVIEEHGDGSRTLWVSDHDPITRMKGMHGICLHPGRASVEIKVRLHNRTPTTQTFLWWANIATRVHERYQSFFPPDVRHIADHARRASSEFPLCGGRYYGVDYGGRASAGTSHADRPPQYAPPVGEYEANDLSWYANIPVPTSYMCVNTSGDFFGGYDHAAEAGLIHVADHHISPGKKQWTWGNHEFGYAWDRNLTDPDEAGEYRPYIELMAGVFTDNQPDFSFLAPGETKTFSQHIYPIQHIGPAKQANADAAVSVSISAGRIRIGVCVTAEFLGAGVTLWVAGNCAAEWRHDLKPGRPFLVETAIDTTVAEDDIRVEVRTAVGHRLIEYKSVPSAEAAPEAATEIPAPRDIESVNELYASGLHLAQYRHATRKPEAYWQEGLTRDPDDSRCNTALGISRFNRGEFAPAEAHFRRAIRRLTRRNSNPYDGEPLYYLGLTLRMSRRDDEAYAVLYKSTWNAAWRTPAFFALAQINCCRSDWSNALKHLDQALRTNTDHLAARNLKAVVLRRLDRPVDADALLAATLALDPLDWMARHLSGEPLACDTQTRIDLALDLLRAGLFQDASPMLMSAAAAPNPGTQPLVHYYLGHIHEKLGDFAKARDKYIKAAAAPADYCFPARLEEIDILQTAIRANPSDARAPYYLGNLLYDRLRHADAIAQWEAAARLDPTHATVWRNLGIGYFNVLRDPERATAAYAKAVAADPNDARLLYESDQLAKRVGMSPAARLETLQAKMPLVHSRDDLSIEFCVLLNQTGRHDDARDLLRSRRFQPWEGGEGLALGQHVRTHTALARIAMRGGDFDRAVELLDAALHSPANLGEAKHLLANQSDVHYLLGLAHEAAGRVERAGAFWTLAAEKRGDFVGMAVQPYSEMTYYSILALTKLGRIAEADRLAAGLAEYAAALLATPAKIDYFATSLPTMLLFDEDIEQSKNFTAAVLLAQAALVAGDRVEAVRLLGEVLAKNPSHAVATELMAELTLSSKDRR